MSPSEIAAIGVLVLLGALGMLVSVLVQKHPKPVPRRPRLPRLRAGQVWLTSVGAVTVRRTLSGWALEYLDDEGAELVRLSFLSRVALKTWLRQRKGHLLTEAPSNRRYRA